MDNVVPHTLQRLRAADVIRMAGLEAASLGQEYSRIGAVQSTKRQGVKLSGVVDLTIAAHGHPTLAARTVATSGQGNDEQRRFSVEVEAQDSPNWQARCTCRSPEAFCRHAAALLYQWITHPLSFEVETAPVSVAAYEASGSPQTAPLVSETSGLQDASKTRSTGARSSQGTGQLSRLTVLRDVSPDEGIGDILAQLGLSELRGIAREYDISISGRNKQQLAEVLEEAIKQPEAIRKVVATLGKPQRQLIAALTLAGGSIPHEDLQGLAERLSLGKPSELQAILVVLQNKGLLFRTTSSQHAQPRIGLSGALLDMLWVVPVEVRSALRVSIPITLFDVSGEKATNGATPEVTTNNPIRLLSGLLLIARALQNQHFESGQERVATQIENLSQSGRFGTALTDGTMAIPAPADTPSDELLGFLTGRSGLAFSPAFLRFALRLLRLSEILYWDEATGTLQVLPNASKLLLDGSHLEVVRDLFSLWLKQTSYDELFELQEHGLQLRCRTTALRQPALRPGELSGENSEARQTLLSFIAQVPYDQWINFTAFARFVYRLSPFFLQRRQRMYPSPHWWFEQQEGHPLRAAQLSEWLQVEGVYLARLLQGALHWWGICDIAQAPDGRLLAFRMNRHAPLLLQEVPDLSSDIPEVGRSEQGLPLQITKNSELLIPCEPASWPILQQVEPFAEVNGIQGRNLAYRLSPHSLSAAFNRGLQPDALLVLLQDCAEHYPELTEVCQRLIGQLERWQQNYAHVRLYTGVSFVEVADTLVLRELNATTSLAAHVVREVQPTLLILKKQGADRLLDELKRRGLSPLVHQEEKHGSE